MDTIRDLMARRFAACQLLANCINSVAPPPAVYGKVYRTMRNFARFSNICPARAAADNPAEDKLLSLVK
jgi:hypothetical protein